MHPNMVQFPKHVLMQIEPAQAIQMLYHQSANSSDVTYSDLDAIRVNGLDFKTEQSLPRKIFREIIRPAKRMWERRYIDKKIIPFSNTETLPLPVTAQSGTKPYG